MSYLLDTDVVIYHLRKKKPLKLSLFWKLIYMSVVTYGELLSGALKSKYPCHNRDLIIDFIEDFNIQIIEVDRQIMEIYAQQRVELEKMGNKLEDFDLLIASTALSHKLSLVTNNTKHFSRIGELKLA